MKGETLRTILYTIELIDIEGGGEIVKRMFLSL